MSKNIDLNLLRTFVAVVDKSNMTAAASALHLTQGAISQQIKRLETLMDTALLHRDHRDLRPTAAGELLLRKALPMLSLDDALWLEMKVSTQSGKVRLGAPYDLVGAGLAPLLRAFADDHPNVDLSLTCGASPDLLLALDKGEIDLALIESPLDDASGMRLGVEPLVWVGARAGSAYLKNPLPVSMVAPTCAFHPAVLEALQGHGREWRTVFENGNLEATTAAVRADLAVTAWLRFTVPQDLQILAPDAGLPALPSFAITLHQSRTNDRAATQLAKLLQQGFPRPVAPL